MSIFIYYECKRIINKNTNIVCLYKRDYIFIQFSKHDKMHMEIHILQNIMCKNAHKLNSRRTQKRRRLQLSIKKNQNTLPDFQTNTFKEISKLNLE